MADTEQNEGSRSNNRSARGFAAMSRQQADEIRRKGGKASPMKFKAGDKRASELGRRGGQASRRSS